MKRQNQISVRGATNQVNTWFGVEHNGIYASEQITNLIVNYGYIPVASGAELNALRNTTLQQMGAGTIWAGNYTTGINASYIQVKDIDLSGYHAGAGWTPIPTLNGVYDGNGLTINNLKILTNGTVQNALIVNLYGMFQNVKFTNVDVKNSGTSTSYYAATVCIFNYGIIHNVEVLSGSVEGYVYVGGVASVNYSLIYRCRNFANIIGNQAAAAHAGGIIGLSRPKSSVVFCVNRGNINIALNHGGGIVGFSPDSGSTIDMCANFGDIISAGSASTFMGGVTGQQRAGALIQNCYNRGNIQHGATATYIGGCAAGYNGTSGILINSYSTGTVNGNAENYRGGLIGRNVSGTITNSYWDTQTSGTNIGTAGTGRTTAEMQTKSPADAGYFVGWNTNIWEFLPTDAYPTLKQIPLLWQQ